MKLNRDDPQMALAGAAFSLVATWSYLLQHLGAKRWGPGGAGDVIKQAHVPFFWRCFGAGWHGLLAALVLLLFVSGLKSRQRWAARLGPWLAALGLLGVLSAGLWP